MSEFWSWWVVILIVFNLGLTFALFLWGPRAKIPVLADGTTGHVWAHGSIREALHRLPMWWIVVSLVMYISAIAYLWRYPGFGNHLGSLGWTSHGELARDTAANNEQFAATIKRFASEPLDKLAGNPEAVVIGEVLFRDNCAACHGRSGHGNQQLGAPNLTDKVWLYGSGDVVLASVLDGRRGTMPPWGPQFGEAGVENLANYVLGLSGAPHDAAKAAAGKTQFVACAACHGADGKGNPALGAPNLTDAVWLYGGDPETVMTSIRDGRAGIMPAWRERLGPDNARLVAAYVLSLSQGGAVASK